MKTVSKALTGIWLLAALLLAGNASADSITFYFEGTITDVVDEGFAGEAFLDDSISPGTDFRGSYTFDSDAPDSSTDPHIGRYVYTSLPNALRVEIGSYIFQSDPANLSLIINVNDGSPTPSADSYQVGSWAEEIGPPISGYINSMTVNWRLGGSGNILSSTDLLTVPPSLEPWIVNELKISGQNTICLAIQCPYFTITGEVTRIVPEPGHLGLLGLLGALGLRRLARREAR